MSALTLSSWRLSRRRAVGSKPERLKNTEKLSRLFPAPLTALFSTRAKFEDTVPASARDTASFLARTRARAVKAAPTLTILHDVRAPSNAQSQRQKRHVPSLANLRAQRSLTLAKITETVVLEDVTVPVGINQPHPSLKFGGPFVGDLDGDGLYDLVLSFHNGIRTRIYFGTEDGSFQLSPFIPQRRDIHGVAAAQRTAHSRDTTLAISVGGGNGDNLKPPEIYLVNSDRIITDISKGYGLGQLASRGRNTLFMDLHLLKKWQKRENKGGPDMLVSNYLGPTSRDLRQFAYENINGEYKLRDVPGFQFQNRGRVEVTDIDNDGIMEVISIRSLEIFKLIEPFTFVDATRDVLPPGFYVPPLSVSAVAEFDMDNDGDFDLYVARADRTLMTHRPANESDDLSDYLLENRNGRYVDVSEHSGIQKGANSMGVSTGDLNNDGYVDVIIIRYKEPDIVLLNQGDGTFQKVDGLIPKDSDTVGNHAVAVDYNLDGRVDILVGHGDVDTINGKYLIMKSQLPLTENSHYLLVTVANEPSRGATALHAVVTVFVRGQRLTRRVGSRGAQGGGGSYLTTVHFGIGSYSSVECVRVRWSNGIHRKVMNVAADQKLFFGVL